MKRLLLLFASLLVGLSTVSATTLGTKNPQERFDRNKNLRYAQPISFVERGVEFLIFPDGSFDFNTNAYNNRYSNTYYGTANRRSSINVGYRGPNVSVNYSSNRYPDNRGVSIVRDYNGNVRRIGNVYLNYDRYGRITRAGSIFIDYNRGHGWLRQVGGLRVNYNRWGEIVSLRGQVNRYNQNCNTCGMINCDHNHRDYDNDHRDHRDHDYDNDKYYYFKQNGEVKKHKKR
ncbi:hypothetical protein [Gaetbulibacter aestuarii]|uniref:Uncharacterized protein n=1 Tax=Gaetbulibacter aestuarii TaxID=1502358 RepID=A0ABW7N1C0_9FLAO